MYCLDRRARAAGVRSDFTALDWAHAMDFFDYSCAYCDEKRKLTRDHVLPFYRGGEHTRTNVVPACGECNDKKGTKLVEDFTTPEIVARIYAFFATLDDAKQRDKEAS